MKTLHRFALVCALGLAFQAEGTRANSYGCDAHCKDMCFDEYQRRYCYNGCYDQCIQNYRPRHHQWRDSGESQRQDDPQKLFMDVIKTLIPGEDTPREQHQHSTYDYRRDNNYWR